MEQHRRSEAARLRSAGLSFRDVAARLGVPLSTVHRWTKDVRGTSTAGLGVLPGPKTSSEGEPVLLDTPEAVWAEFGAVYQRAMIDGDISQQVRMLLGRAEARKGLQQSVQGCTGHIAVSLVSERWVRLREMQLSILDAAIRIDDLSGVTSRVDQAWRLMLDGYRQEDSEGL